MTGLITSRAGALAVSAIALLGVLAPARRLRHPGARDTFPLSHYPMFSARRGPHLTVHHLQGVAEDGSVRLLDSRLAATGGMNQERKQIAREARRGRGDRVALRAAKRLARRGGEPDVVEVRVVSGSFALALAFSKPVMSEDAVVLGSAEVPGRWRHPAAGAAWADAATGRRGGR